jgi:hypothetical protein
MSLRPGHIIFFKAKGQDMEGNPGTRAAHHDVFHAIQCYEVVCDLFGGLEEDIGHRLCLGCAGLTFGGGPV